MPQRDGHLSAGHHELCGTAAEQALRRIGDQPPAGGDVAGLDGVAAGGEQVVQFLRTVRQVIQPGRLQARLVEPLGQRAPRGDDADALAGAVPRAQGVDGGVDDVQDGRRAVRAERVPPQVRGVARDGDAGRARCVQARDALPHRGQRVLAGARQRQLAVGNLRHVPGDGGHMVLVAPRGACLQELVQEVQRGQRPHAAEHAHEPGHGQNAASGASVER
jgi:hypothetical protein